VEAALQGQNKQVELFREQAELALAESSRAATAAMSTPEEVDVILSRPEGYQGLNGAIIQILDGV
jgi:hypothetical protein